MPVVGVQMGTAQQLLQPNQQTGVSLQNIGPGNVYIGDASSLTATNFGWYLTVGSSITWSPGKALWVVSDAPGTKLNYLDSVDGATATNVTATLSGPVNTIPSGTQNVSGTVVGDPSALPILQNQLFTVPGGTFGYIIAANLDVSGYASIMVQSNPGTLGGSSGYVVAATQLVFNWMDSLGNTIATEQCGVFCTGSLNWTVPVRARYLQISMPFVTSTFYANVFNVYGFRTARPRRYISYPYGGSPTGGGSSPLQPATVFSSVESGISGFDWTANAVPVNGDVTLMIPSMAGMCTTSYVNPNNTPQIKLNALTGGGFGLATLLQQISPTTNSTTSQTSLLPEQPLVFSLHNSGAAAATLRSVSVFTWQPV